MKKDELNNYVKFDIEIGDRFQTLGGEVTVIAIHYGNHFIGYEETQLVTPRYGSLLVLKRTDYGLSKNHIIKRKNFFW